MLKENGEYIYPTTYYNQVILPDGTRWDGESGSGNVYVGDELPEDLAPGKEVTLWIDTDEPDPIIGQEIYIGDTEPAETSYDLWIDTSKEAVEVMRKDAIKYKQFSIEQTDWSGSGPYTWEVEAPGITENTAIINLTLDATSQTYQKAQLDWETGANTITLSTSIKPTGKIAGYLIATEVAVI